MIPDKIRVILLARELGPGGSERQLTEIARHLDKSRFAVSAGCFHEGVRSEELRDSGIPVIRIPVRSFSKPHAAREAFRFGEYLRRNRFDIVHTFDYPLTCFATPVAKAFGVPVVLSSQRGHRSLIPFPYLALVRATDLIVDGIVVNCRAMECHLVREEDVAQRKTHVCYNGIDLIRFPGSIGSGQKSPPDRQTITVGCVSVLRPEKNLTLLLHAFSLASRADSRLRLMIVGSGGEEKNLRTLAAQLKIPDDFLLPGTKDIAPALGLMDIFVLPSLTEAFSNSLMEAMASRCAVIASDTGGNPELVEHGITGLLFRNNDRFDLLKKITLLSQDRGLRERLGSRARRFLENQFTMSHAARRMGEIYDVLLSGKNDRHES